MTIPPTLATTMTAGELMSKTVYCVNQEASCKELMEILLDYRITGVPVVNDHGELVGTIAMRDVLAFKKDISYLPSIADMQKGFVRNYMVQKVFAVKPSTPLTEVAQLMRSQHIHRVIVIDDNYRPIGMVSAYDFLQFF